MCRQITCRRRQSSLSRQLPRTGSAHCWPCSILRRIQPTRLNNTLPGKSRAACQLPSGSSSRISPSGVMRKRQQRTKPRLIPTSSLTKRVSQPTLPATSSSQWRGKVSISAMPAAPKMLPEKRTSQRSTASGYSSAEYVLDDTRDRLRVVRLPLQ